MLAEKPDICIYHYPCIDGFSSAYMVWRHFNVERNDDIEFMPGDYKKAQQFDFAKLKDKKVLMVDFSFPKEEMHYAASLAKNICVIDHHAGASPILDEVSKLRKNVTFIFDNSECGTSLTAKTLEIWFHLSQNEKAIVDYIRDRDLWLKQYPETDYLTNLFTATPYDFVSWDNIFASDVAALLDKGRIMQQYKESVNEFCKEFAWEEQDWRGFKDIPVVNCPVMFSSEILNDLAKGKKFAVGYHDQEGKRVYSLRSSKESKTDVSEIARRFGGNGHFNAAGFAEIL